MLAFIAVAVPTQAAPIATSSPRASRVCAARVAPRTVSCLAWVRTGVTGAAAVSPSVPSGFGPTQFHAAYSLPTTAPTSQTIAIVDAYNNPKVFSDLKAYNAAMGLPAFPKCNQKHKTACFKVLNQNGTATPLPNGDVSWGLEISLDVQVAHAICQNCKILLVEASSAEFSDIEIAVNTAVKKGAKIVSNSYGDYGNDCAEPGYDRPGIAMVVSSGDSGFKVSCPAVLSSVVSVGGTHLTLNGGGGYGSESVWNGSGSGCSAFSQARSWQTSLSGWAGTGCGTGRAMNDVAADADPATGAAVFDSYGYGGWLVVGGTSLSAPIIAGAFALAARATPLSYPAQGLYTAPAAAFHDVTVGSNGSCTISIQCHAANGYDLPTGVGTPKGLGGF